MSVSVNVSVGCELCSGWGVVVGWVCGVVWALACVVGGMGDCNFRVALLLNVHYYSRGVGVAER
jgi:hypothetical protein